MMLGGYKYEVLPFLGDSVFHSAIKQFVQVVSAFEALFSTLLKNTAQKSIKNPKLTLLFQRCRQ